MRFRNAVLCTLGVSALFVGIGTTITGVPSLAASPGSNSPAHASPQPPPPNARSFADNLREALRAEPELIEQALAQLQAKRLAAQQQHAETALASVRSALFEKPHAFFEGQAASPALLVAFLDYNCGYCKASAPEETALVAAANIQVRHRAIAILGPGSEVGARAAIAAEEQGHDAYLKLHKAMLGFRGNLDQVGLERIAVEQGLDLTRLLADMKSAKTSAQLTENFSLMRSLGINGTPTYVTPKTILRGAVGQAAMRKAVEDARP